MDAREDYVQPDEGPTQNGTLASLSFLLMILGGIVSFTLFRDQPQYRPAAIAIGVGGLLPFAIMMFRFAQLRNRIGTAELRFPYESLALGYAATATYARPLRNGAEVQSV